ncbi:hypothetical protein INT47_011960 [Mucor saturninus]|uniref:C2H2-type domain-containing protein n=1 Tax=Mucor saturninus TaxID=64648 RepID=A0A8H7V2D4_9FUNG|nr:hypothetical protein INT47_011960 [Mucor saturninus]
MSEKRPLPSPSTSGTARKSVRPTDLAEGPSNAERARKMKELMSQVSSLRNTIPSGEESHLALRSKVSYKEKEDRYLKFISDTNSMREYEDPPQPPLEPFTQFSFNIDMLKDYITSRSLLAVGRVENKMQLGTMIREITHLVKIAQRKNPKLQLDENFTRQLHTYTYQMSTIGYFGRKGKPQAIFGRQELLIIVNNSMSKAPASGNINFEYQIIIFFLIVLYTGVRPSSLSKAVKHEDAKFLQWKHVTIWRGERDDHGFKINVVITIPHLKGRGNYFSESNRTFKKTFTSTLDPEIPYERNLDVALFICALAFRRGITTVATPQEWYESNSVLLQLKESRAETPVFTRSSNDQENDNPQPLTSTSAEHTASRRIRDSGLNIHGTLYSFRRNFAQIINDNLSNSTASTLMGHTPASLTLKKAYAGRFDQLDMTKLVTTGEAIQGPTIDPMLNPAAFHIKDISRYYLNEEEKRDGVDTDIRVQALFNARETFTKSLMKRYGSKSHKNWSKEEKKELKEHNRVYKQARRVAIVRLTRAKLIRLYGQVNQALKLNEEGVHEYDDEKEQDNEIVESFEGEDEWGEYNDESQASDSEEEEELILEEDQASDYITSSQERIQEPPTTLEAVENENTSDRLRDRRFLNLMELVNLRLRPSGKSLCNWCIEENFQSREHQGYVDLVVHLFDSQVSRYSWVDRNLSGRHTNSERWLRAHLPKQLQVGFSCSVEKCSYSVKAKPTMMKHIRTEHLDVLLKSKDIVDVSPDEAAQLVQDYLKEHYQYLMPDEEKNKLYQENDDRRKSMVRRRKAESKEKDTTKDNGKGKDVKRKKGKSTFEGEVKTGVRTRAQRIRSNAETESKDKGKVKGKGKMPKNKRD